MMKKHIVPAVIMLIGFSLFACSDDASSKQDQGVKDQAVMADQSTHQEAAIDQQVDLQQPDQKQVDLNTTPGKIVDKNHAGWKEIDCHASGCHPQPVDQAAQHANIQQPACASCHGGNGACDPNGTNSGKQNHSKTLPCVSCHFDVHDQLFTSSSACVLCHYAAAGVDQSCP